MPRPPPTKMIRRCRPRPRRQRLVAVWEIPPREVSGRQDLHELRKPPQGCWDSRSVGVRMQYPDTMSCPDHLISCRPLIIGSEIRWASNLARRPGVIAGQTAGIDAIRIDHRTDNLIYPVSMILVTVLSYYHLRRLLKTRRAVPEKLSRPLIKCKYRLRCSWADVLRNKEWFIRKGNPRVDQTCFSAPIHLLTANGLRALLGHRLGGNEPLKKQVALAEICMPKCVVPP